MKNLIIIVALVGIAYLAANQLGFNPFKESLPAQAEAAYIGYSEGILANHINEAKQYATGTAADISDDRSYVEKWLLGGKYIAASNYKIISIQASGDSIEMETTFRYVPSGGMLGDRNPGNPKNWLTSRHYVTLISLDDGWKVSDFEVQQDDTSSN